MFPYSPPAPESRGKDFEESMATLSKLKPGQILFETTRRTMGNTTMKTTSVYRIEVKEVHEDHVIASWNGNTPKRYPQFKIGGWRVTKPIMVESRTMGSMRVAHRDEIAQARAEGRLVERLDRISIVHQAVAHA